MYDDPWREGNAFLRLLLFQLQWSKVSNFKSRSHTTLETHERTVVSRKYPPLNYFPFCITYFSTKSCIICHVWFTGEVLKFGFRVSPGFHLSISKSVLTSGWTPPFTRSYVFMLKHLSQFPSPIIISYNQDASFMSYLFPRGNIQSETVMRSVWQCVNPAVLNTVSVIRGSRTTVIVSASLTVACKVSGRCGSNSNSSPNIYHRET